LSKSKPCKNSWWNSR